VIGGGRAFVERSATFDCESESREEMATSLSDCGPISSVRLPRSP
jgi:hypothetical protein